uniref:NADH-quinone oxidoreductase subunit B family protein n=1 Tax=Komagataeibacter kakiaceti TaxID=943261 RepID=UPI001F59F8CF|nr:HupU protein [Komagataeibacter kakiaceti]
MSLLCAESPDLLTTLRGAGIDLLWHPSLSARMGVDALELFGDVLAGRVALDALCVEGAMLRGPEGTGRFHTLAGTDVAMIDWVRRLSGVARHVVAVGSCSAYGGMTAAAPNILDACGLQYDGQYPGGALGAGFVARGGLPVVNVAGCPTHPDWVTETLMLLARNMMDADALDDFRRPRFYADQLVHHGCTRNEFYEYKASARHPSELGCMMEHMAASARRRMETAIRGCGTGAGHAPRGICVHQLHRPGIRGARTSLLPNTQDRGHSRRPANRYAQGMVRGAVVTGEGGHARTAGKERRQ